MGQYITQTSTQLVNLNLKKKSDNHNTLHVGEGVVLMLSGAIFMSMGLFTPQESHWEGTQSFHTDPTSGTNVDTPIYKQSSRYLPLLTGIGLFIPGIAITIGDN